MTDIKTKINYLLKVNRVSINAIIKPRNMSQI